jgi:hypothetical protein
MMKARVLLLVLSLLSCLVMAFPLTAEELAYGTPIFIHGKAADAAERQIAGRGIPLSGGRMTPAAYDAQGREVVWREIGRRVDPRGGTHVFYRQFLSDGGVEAELVGSDLGLHYDRNGRLGFIGGNQFVSVTVTNAPEIGPEIASERAHHALQAPAPGRALTESVVEDRVRTERASRSKLQIVRRDNGEFRYVWRTTAAGANGVEQEVLVDAESERIVATNALQRFGNCSPEDPQAPVAAIGRPSHPNMGSIERSLIATEAPNRFYWFSGSSYWAPFTHEAFWPGQGNVPDVAVYQELGAAGYPSDWNTIEFRCNQSADLSYSLMPLRADDPFGSGSITDPVYENDHGWKGRAAGDALHHTHETMLAFAYMSWNGWDGYGTEASVVLESTLVPADTGVFFRPGTGGSKIPSWGGIAISASVDYHHLATSLDLIGHEWGHGINDAKAGGAFAATTVGSEMDEGWADIVSTIVEKLRQPAGSGLEQSSDWTMHEDSGAGGYARGALDDDSDSEVGHRWYKKTSGYRLYKDRIHKDDPHFDATPHATGNMLVMAMKLLAEGGYNPICSRSGTNPVTGLAYSASTGCSTSVAAQGLSTAIQIMWDTLLYRVPSTVTWETVGNYAMQTAYENYRVCGAGNNALAKQTAVKNAFSAIGYPPTVPFYTCP